MPFGSRRDGLSFVAAGLRGAAKNEVIARLLRQRTLGQMPLRKLCRILAWRNVLRYVAVR